MEGLRHYMASSLIQEKLPSDQGLSLTPGKEASEGLSLTRLALLLLTHPSSHGQLCRFPCEKPNQNIESAWFGLSFLHRHILERTVTIFEARVCGNHITNWHINAVFRWTHLAYWQVKYNLHVALSCKVKTNSVRYLTFCFLKVPSIHPELCNYPQVFLLVN